MSDDLVNVGTGPHAPDVLGSVYGVRQWSVGSSGLLSGWHPGVNTAVCRTQDPIISGAHVPPAKNCGCGFYAYHHRGGFNANGVYGDVTGVVRGWGQMAIAPDGWRAQYAEVVGILDTGAENEAVVASVYQVPLLTTTELDLLVEEYGVPKDLIPKGAQSRPPALPRINFDSGSGVAVRNTQAKREVARMLMYLWGAIAVVMLLLERSDWAPIVGIALVVGLVLGRLTR